MATKKEQLRVADEDEQFLELFMKYEGGVPDSELVSIGKQVLHYKPYAVDSYYRSIVELVLKAQKFIKEGDVWRRRVSVNTGWKPKTTEERDVIEGIRGRRVG